MIAAQREAQRRMEECRARVAQRARELTAAHFAAEQQAAQLAADQTAAEERAKQQQQVAHWEAQRMRDEAALQARNAAVEQQYEFERDRQARAAEQAAIEQQRQEQEAAAAAAALTNDFSADNCSIHSFTSHFSPLLGPSGGTGGAELRRQSPVRPERSSGAVAVSPGNAERVGLATTTRFTLQVDAIKAYLFLQT
jgi:hypothetical protein